MGLATVVANVNGCMKGDPVKITQHKNVGTILHTNCLAYTLPNFTLGKKGVSTLRGRGIKFISKKKNQGDHVRT